MKQWHWVGTLLASTTLGLLVLMPAAPSLADSCRLHSPTARFHTPAFQRDRHELWSDRAEVRRDQHELWRDQRAHRWGEVAHTVAVPGQSLILNTVSSNYGFMFVVLKPFHERRGAATVDHRALHSRRPWGFGPWAGVSWTWVMRFTRPSSQVSLRWTV